MTMDKVKKQPLQGLELERQLANRLNIKTYGPESGPFVVVSHSERRIYVFGNDYGVSSNSSFSTNLMEVLCDALPYDSWLTEVDGLTKIVGAGVSAVGNTAEEAAMRLLVENPWMASLPTDEAPVGCLADEMFKSS